MALNPQYEVIGKGFVQQYYALFDDPAQRPNLINMYNVSPNCSQLRIIDSVDCFEHNCWMLYFADRDVFHDV